MNGRMNMGEGLQMGDLAYCGAGSRDGVIGAFLCTLLDIQCASFRRAK